MSVDRLLQKYTGFTDEPIDGENVQDEGSFGLLRGQRDRALMVELRKKDGSVLAIPYTMIEQLRYGASEGITIRVGGREIRIAGRQLNSDQRPGLFNALARHRVVWISENDRAEVIAAEASTVAVELIAW